MSIERVARPPKLPFAHAIISAIFGLFAFARYLTEKTAAEELMVDLSKEVERVRAECGPALPHTSPEVFRLEELHHDLDDARRANRTLQEQNEELQAMIMARGVEEGRSLLLNGTSNNLADELGEMSERQVNEHGQHVQICTKLYTSCG